MPRAVAPLMTFVVGLQMVISPFVMKAQAVGATWSAGTINAMAMGGLLIAVSLCGVGITLGLGLRDFTQAAGQRSEQALDEPAT